MRKILTNGLRVLERENHTTSDLGWKSQGFFEKKSNVFSTSRREIFTKPWLFQIIPTLFFAKSLTFFEEKHKKALTFFIFNAKSVIFDPLRIAYFRPTDHVMTFARFMTSENAKNFDKIVIFYLWKSYNGALSKHFLRDK